MASATGPDREWARILGSVPRRSAPDLPLETILERWQRRRRRSMVMGGLSAAIVLVALVVFRPAQTEPPVHVDFRIVDLSAGESGEAGDIEGAWEEGPEELRGP